MGDTMHQHDTSRPRAVATLTQTRAADLQALLTDTFVDEHDVEQHGLAWWYPQLKHWPTVRSVGAGRGGATGALPLNVEAVDFIGGRYFIGDTGDDIDDPLNYRDGFEPTVLELEKSVRRSLGQLPPARQPRAADPLQPTPAVLAALEHLQACIDAIAASELLYELVVAEAARLIVRARGMMHGSRFTAGRSQCMYCFVPESVISDEDRAVCVTPFCRTSDGARRCWRMLPVDDNGRPIPGAQWVAVNEPDLRGRGQVTDEQLSRWADVG
jgi:hypothetical protein